MKKKLRRIAVFPVPLAVQIAMGRVYALKNVRLFYKKKGRMKFISHLDMNRFFTEKAIFQYGTPKVLILILISPLPHPFLWALKASTK